MARSKGVNDVRKQTSRIIETARQQRRALDNKFRIGQISYDEYAKRFQQIFRRMSKAYDKGNEYVRNMNSSQRGRQLDDNVLRTIQAYNAESSRIRDKYGVDSIRYTDISREDANVLSSADRAHRAALQAREDAKFSRSEYMSNPTTASRGAVVK